MEVIREPSSLTPQWIDRLATGLIIWGNAALYRLTLFFWYWSPYEKRLLRLSPQLLHHPTNGIFFSVTTFTLSVETTILENMYSRVPLPPLTRCNPSLFFDLIPSWVTGSPHTRQPKQSWVDWCDTYFKGFPPRFSRGDPQTKLREEIMIDVWWENSDRSQDRTQKTHSYRPTKSHSLDKLTPGYRPSLFFFSTCDSEDQEF